MKEGVIIINTARGKIIDSEALINGIIILIKPGLIKLWINPGFMCEEWFNHIELNSMSPAIQSH